MLSLRSSAVALALLLAPSAFAAPLDVSDAAPGLVKRAATCSKASNCHASLPAHAQHTCVSKKCSWKCNTEYKKSGSKCVKIKTTKKKTTTTKKKTTTTKARAAAATANVAASDIEEDALTGVTAFLGTNTNAIVSWFEPDSTRDSTNGHSWCLFPYSDATPGFAPSLATMLAAAGGSADKARELFCGLEAVVTSASGEKLTLYIADAFDDTWVRTPSSIDVIHPFFNTLYGKATNDKDDVLKKAKWKFTGRRNARYASRGVGDS